MYFIHMKKLPFSNYCWRGKLLRNVHLQKTSNGCAICSRAYAICNSRRRNFNVKPKIAFNSNDFMYSHHSYSIYKGLIGFENEFCATFCTIRLQSRSFQTKSLKRNKEEDKPSSQVEVTVKDLKEKSQTSPSAILTPPRKSLYVIIKDEILHYYHGFKLLYIDMKIGSKYIYRLMKGENLTRRERRQLIRTTGDLFRLVPFSVFIIIPFMEFLLPVALKLFPGMLPSTFETSNEKEAKMKKKLKVKLEMAKFLQQTLDSMAVEGKGHYSQRAKDFVEFFEKTHRTGQYISNEEIMKFSKLFKDEITLDSLSRPQLTALCRLLEMQPFGTNNFLRFQLRMKLRSLAADDKIIQREGVDSLAVWELQQACRSRGMRAFGMSKERLEMQLNQWLDLSLNEKVPPSLLLLSRTLFVPSDIPPEETLAATISTLPEEVATRTKASIGKREGKLDNVTRLEIIKSEEKKIKEDQMEEMEEKKRIEMAKKKEEQALQIAAYEQMADALKGKVPSEALEEPPSTDKLIADVAAATVRPQPDKEILQDTAPTLVDTAQEITTPTEKPIELTAEDIEDVEEALEMLEIEKKSHFIEESELSELKSEMADYQEDIKDFKEIMEKTGIDAKHLKESKAARRLYGRVNKMITKMEPLMNALNEQKISIKEHLQEQDVASDKEAELVDIEELVKHIEYMISAPDSSKLEMIKKVLEKMDDDLDGSVKVEDVLKVLKLISEEHVSSVSGKLFNEIIETMAKEEQLETKTILEMALQFPYKSRQEPPPSEKGMRPPSNSNGEICQKVADLTTTEKVPKDVKTKH